MQANWIDLTIVIVYFLFILFIGFYSTKKIKSFDDYSVAGRSVPGSLLFATLAATIIGGGATIGRVSLVYETGLIALVAISGVISIHLLSGFFIAPRMRELKDAYTVSDVMGYYFSNSSRVITSILSFIYCVGLFGTQILAMGRILEALTGINYVYMTLFAAGFTILYTYSGGMWAVIYTDAVQFIILTLGVTTATIFGVQQAGGMAAVINNVATFEPSRLLVDGGMPVIAVIGFFLTFFLGEAIAPYYVQRYVSSTTPKASKWSSIALGMFFGFFASMVTIIGLITITGMPDANKDVVFLEFISQYLPVGLVGLTFGGLIASVMSTGDSILNTSATIFTRDIYQRYINPKANQTVLLRWSRMITLIVGVGGILVTFLVPYVLDLMMYTYNVWAPSVVPPIVIALLWGKAIDKKVSAKAATPAIIVGLVTSIIWMNMLGDPFDIPGIVVGIVCNLIVFFAVHYSASGKTA